MQKFKQIMAAALTAGLVVTQPLNSLACTLIYVGADLTEDGGTYFARSEDMGNSSEKLFYVSEAGTHKAGETYVGCYGFTYTFSHDTYSYTAFRDNNINGGDGECPDCEEVKENHTPYEEAGTNEKGLSMSATESLYPNLAVQEADPFTDEGIEEADTATVILGEASCARQGLDILMAIWDTVGSNSAAGIILADQKEAWYVENATGHEYLAVKLPSDMIFIEPNVSVFGNIDLDDTEHVIASKGIIETAKAAGTFVGDESQNIINFRASYFNEAEDKELPEEEWAFDSRLVNGLNYLNAAYAYTEDNIKDADFTMSNIAADGSITKLSTNIVPDRKMATNDVVRFYKVEDIGYYANESTSFFQIYADNKDAKTATIEWLTLANGQYNVMVPYYPMLTKDVNPSYHVGLVAADRQKEEPESGEYYYFPKKGQYIVFPEGWQDSYYWCMDAVASKLDIDDASYEKKALAIDTYNELQIKIYKDFEEAKENIKNMSDEERANYMTNFSAKEAQNVKDTALNLYQQIK